MQEYQFKDHPEAEIVAGNLPHVLQCCGEGVLTLRDYTAFKGFDREAVGKLLAALSVEFSQYKPADRGQLLNALCDPTSTVGKKVLKVYRGNIRSAVTYILVRFEAAMFTRSILLARGFKIASPRSGLGSFFWQLAATWDISLQPGRGFKLDEGVQEELAEEMH